MNVFYNFFFMNMEYGEEAIWDRSAFVDFSLFFFFYVVVNDYF